jgi:hypothetical protein
MTYVYYINETIERKREDVGFSCKRYKVNQLVGEYEDTVAAKKHPNSDKEKEFPDGFYMITPNKLEEKELLPPKTPPKPKVDKKKKK